MKQDISRLSIVILLMKALRRYRGRWVGSDETLAWISKGLTSSACLKQPC
ncbi:hypothetical protein PCAR4_810080 [Paraburkholderia caribensis]|nr:hypothetical protein PCAR4_810080 [Paraburkholderia caribensis]